MPTEQILGILIAERDKLNRAIEALQGPLRRRGRPPKNSLLTADPVPELRTRIRTPAQRKAQSERMKKYWAQRRKLKE